MECLYHSHHLLKTFWGWRDKQLPDATVIWTMPDSELGDGSGAFIARSRSAAGWPASLSRFIQCHHGQYR
jgi:hypothetical protein